MRYLIAWVMRSKLVWVLTGIAAIPGVAGYLTFLTIRWTYRQLRNGCVMIFLSTAVLVGGAYLWLSPTQAASTFALILLLHGVWFSRKGELFVVWWRAQWRYWTKYRWLWGTAIRGANLVSMDPKHPGVKARIHSVTANEFVDRLEVRMSAHQTPELYQREMKGIRQTLGAVGGRAVQSRRDVQNVTLWLWKTDPLNQIVRPYAHRPPPEDGDWEAWFAQGTERAAASSGNTWPVCRAAAGDYAGESSAKKCDGPALNGATHAPQILPRKSREPQSLASTQFRCSSYHNHTSSYQNRSL